jgi:RNA polymerase sigma-70 factor (ECF subfamily)
MGGLGGGTGDRRRCPGRAEGRPGRLCLAPGTLPESALSLSSALGAREEASAEDLFQQTWLRVIENIGRYDPRRNFEAWLFTVARNVAIDHLRRRRPGSLDESAGENPSLGESLPAVTPGALDQILCSERAELVQRALESQLPLYREILSLRFEEEMKLEEIAEVLSIPLGTVKSRLARALEQLRASFLRMRLEELSP